MKVGFISDTHGLLRPEVFEHFEGVDHILHAGDVGPSDLLVELEAIAPVTAVWGNTDGWDLRTRVPEVARVELGGVSVVVVHGQQVGSPTPAKVAHAYPEADVVVFGHSHVPVIERVGRVLAVNPGSFGPIRFGRSPTLAVGHIDPAGCSAELITLPRL